MRPLRFAATMIAVSASALFGQSEAALRDSFEGRHVTVKIDMPATKDGIDVFPLEQRPLDLQRYSARIKAHGVALRRGDSVMVTLVKVKDKNIEFQLGGGGFGTLGDESGEMVTAPTTSKSKREKELEEERKTVTDKAKKKSIDRELNDLRSTRTRDDARLHAEAAQAEEARKARVRQQALDGGSRFNLWFPGRVPQEMLRPERIREALAAYVEFDEAADFAVDPREGAASGADAAASAGAPVLGGAPAGLRKGMAFSEVTAAFGEPQSCVDRDEGTLKVTTCQYQFADTRAEGQFVEGILLRYSIQSQ